MKSRILLVGIMCLWLSACFWQTPVAERIYVDVTEYTLQERREAFLRAIWGDVPSYGTLGRTPFQHITFDRTVVRSFEDALFFTVVMFEHHPYLINPDENLEVYIAPNTSFNLLQLPGRFEGLERFELEPGIHTVTGFHNGVPFEMEFEEEFDYD